MADELSLQRDASRAAKAQALVDNELIKEAFAVLEAAYYETWKASTLNDAEGRERLWQAAKIIGSVQAHLETIIVNGKLAKAELEQIRAAPSAYGT